MDEGRPVSESSMGEVVGHEYTCTNRTCGFTKMSYIEDGYDYQVLTAEGEITFPLRD